jgi:hypothetical protein
MICKLSWQKNFNSVAGKKKNFRIWNFVWQETKGNNFFHERENKIYNFVSTIFQRIFLTAFFFETCINSELVLPLFFFVRAGEWGPSKKNNNGIGSGVNCFLTVKTTSELAILIDFQLFFPHLYNSFKHKIQLFFLFQNFTMRKQNCCLLALVPKKKRKMIKWSRYFMSQSSLMILLEAKVSKLFLSKWLQEADHDELLCQRLTQTEAYGMWSDKHPGSSSCDG